MMDATSAAPQSGTLFAAIDWIGAVLTGSVGTTVAILAIAAVGLLMLRGRLPVRRGATVILGCFVLFGASTISDGITGATSPADPAPPAPMAAPQAVYQPTVPKPVPYDPYAGASVPRPRADGIMQ